MELAFMAKKTEQMVNFLRKGFQAEETLYCFIALATWKQLLKDRSRRALALIVPL